MKSGGLKRTADCVLAAGGIALLLPVWAGAAAVCALSGEGVIYRQERIGRDGKPFFVCKFRTMRKEAPVLPREALAEPERYYIPGGAFLRSTGIDELPQLWNVLRGEMSLIGPRPLIAGEGGIHRMPTGRHVRPAPRDHGAVPALRRSAPADEDGDRSAVSGKRLPGDGRSRRAGDGLSFGEQTKREGKNYRRENREISAKLLKSTCNLSQNVV